MLVESQRQEIINNELYHHKKELDFLRTLELRTLEEIEEKDLLLAVENVSFAYPEQLRMTVEDISFRIPKYGIMALLGPSGSGKSTILRLIAGFEAPFNGRIIINGQVVAGEGVLMPPERRKVGVVFQDYALFPHLNIFDNIAFGLNRWKKNEKLERIEQMFNMVDLAGFEKRFPHQLSGGQQQRVAIARTLAPKPKLLLLDEPFSNLDESLRERVREEILQILKIESMPTILVTHDRHDVIRLADRAISIHKGKLVSLC